MPARSLVRADASITVDEVDVTSLESVFRRDYRPLCVLAAIITGDRARAEELVMDTFTRCLGDWPRVAAAGDPAGYLRRAVVNRSRDHLRRRATEWRVNAAHAARSPESTHLPEYDDEVLRAVRQLPRGQRAVIALAYYCDLSISDVAATLGVREGTVKSQLAKARSALATMLGGDR